MPFQKINSFRNITSLDSCITYIITQVLLFLFYHNIFRKKKRVAPDIMEEEQEEHILEMYLHDFVVRQISKERKDKHHPKDWEPSYST